MLILPRLMPNVTGYGDPARSSGGGGGASEFDPTSIGTGCVCWLKPVASTMLTDNIDGSSSVSTDGEAVGRWEDQSGVGNHATQSSIGGLRPTYRTGIQNSLPMLLFDGASGTLGDHLRANNLAAYFTGDDADATVAIVFKKVTNVGNDALFSASNAAGTSFLSIYNNATQYLARKFDGTNDAARSYAVADDLAAHLLIVRMNGTTVDLWRDNVQGINGAAFNVNSVTFDAAAIGARINGGGINDACNAYIGEVIVWDNPLSNANITAVQDGLLSKWGLS